MSRKVLSLSLSVCVCVCVCVARAYPGVEDTRILYRRRLERSTPTSLLSIVLLSENFPADKKKETTAGDQTRDERREIGETN
jgi:hypothetical protein